MNFKTLEIELCSVQKCFSVHRCSLYNSRHSVYCIYLYIWVLSVPLKKENYYFVYKPKYSVFLLVCKYNVNVFIV